MSVPSLLKPARRTGSATWKVLQYLSLPLY